MPRRNVKVTLKTEEQLRERVLKNRQNALRAYYLKKGINRELDNRSECEKARKVKCCLECCRFAYCKGFEKNPFKEKAIDLFLNTRKE